MEKVTEYDAEKAVHDRPGGFSVVVYNAQAPLTYEKLEVLYKQALEH